MSVVTARAATAIDAFTFRLREIKMMLPGTVLVPLAVVTLVA
jgi:hypothetical protein